MRRNILLGFILSIFFFPLVVAGAIEPSLPNSSTNIGESTTKPSSSSSIVPNTNNGSPFLPNNNFNIVEFDKNTNKPKLVDPADNAKKALDNARKSREAKEALEKKEADSRKLTYDNYKSKMSDLTSKVYFDKKFFGFDSNMNYFFNAVVQAIFWLSKFIFTIIAGIYNAVEGMSDISTLLNKVIGNSSKVFSSLFSKEIVYVIGASMAVYLLYLFATGNGSVLKAFVKMLLIYTLIGLYFIKINVNEQNKYLLTHLYDGFRTTTISLNGQITKTLTNENSNAIDVYFTETIVKSYKYMNSPLKEDGEFQLSEAEFEDLAGYKQGDGDYLVGGKKIKDIAKDKDPENKMLKSEWGAKFSYAFSSLIDVTVVGIVYLVLGLARFFFLMIYVFLILILPFILLVSLFPSMEGLIHSFNKKAISMLILSSVTLLATTLFVFFYNSLTDFISWVVGQNVLVVIFLKAILLYLLFKNKNMILSMFSRIGHLPVNRMKGLNLNQGTKKIRERVLGAGKSGLSAGGQFAKGGLKMGKDNLQSRLKGLRSNSTQSKGTHSDGSHSKNESLGKFGNRYASMKHGVRGTVNSFKEKGNRTMASFYKVRASAFRDQESHEFKALDSKKDSLLAKAESQEKIKNSSYAEVKRLKEQRLARKKAEFEAKKGQRMNQVDSGKNPKIDTPKIKRMKGENSSPKGKRMKGEKSSPKKQGRKNKKNRPNVTIDRKRNKI
jgi:putative membrane protein